MEKHTSTSFGSTKTLNLVKIAVVAALYFVMTTFVAPFSFGALQFRVSEILNFLGVHNKRYIIGLTIGVFIANILNPSSYGIADMFIGSLSTLVFVWLGAVVGDKIVAAMSKDGQIVKHALIIKYIAMIVVFSLSMITIAMMICHFENIWPLFWPTYFSLIASEAFILTIGAFIMYPLSTRLNFDA